MHAISVKELREKMPLVRSELKKGESFLIIYKSKPIAQLAPIPKESDEAFHAAATLGENDEFEDWQNAAGQEWAKLPPTTKTEHDYYTSLPPLKD